MGIMAAGFYELIKDYVHPNFNKFINYYKDGHHHFMAVVFIIIEMEQGNL